MAKTVLLVEDDFFIRELYQKALEMKGMKVVTATDGGEAIDLFAKEKPDIVLLDIMLPTMSGMDVLKHIKAEAKDQNKTPVIMISNLDSPEAIEQAQRLGADDYWVKALKTPLEAADTVNHYQIG